MSSLYDHLCKQGKLNGCGLMICLSLRDFILALESNIRSDREFLILLLVNLRSLYHPFLSSSSPKDIGCASQEDTVLGVLDEVSCLSDVSC